MAISVDLNQCRLCLQRYTDTTLIDLCGEKGVQLGVSSILKKHFWFLVNISYIAILLYNYKPYFTDHRKDVNCDDEYSSKNMPIMLDKNIGFPFILYTH